MHRYIGVLSLVMVLMVPALGAHATNSDSAPPKSLSVVVRDESNSPMADVLVQALDRFGLLNDAQSLTSVTGATRLRFPPQRARVTVVIQRDGYQSQLFEVNPDTVQGALNVVLSRAAKGTFAHCTADSRPGIRVLLTGAVPRDSVTVRVVARDGSFADSSSANAQTRGFPISLAYERAGSYTITLSAPGYRTWQRRDVRVPLSSEGCHRVGFPQVVEAELTARP